MRESIITPEVTEVLFILKLCKGIEPFELARIALSFMIPSTSPTSSELKARLASDTSAMYSVTDLSAWITRLV